MDHVMVNEGYRVWHGASHLDDALQAPVNHEHFDLYAQGPTTDTPYKPGEHIPGLNIGGWYDAGDHGKYVVNSGMTVYQLLSAYERTRNADVVDRGALGDSTLLIPERDNGVPDILDEIKWNLDWMLSMQVPEGKPKAGMVHHKVHDIGWTGLPLAPHEDGNERALVPPSTTATLNLAATGAQCARLWKNIDSAYANRCLTAAQTAWEAARRNPNDLYHGGYDDGGGAYGDGNAADEFYWAAAELYLTTGEQVFADFVLASPQIGRASCRERV